MPPSPLTAPASVTRPEILPTGVKVRLGAVPGALTAALSVCSAVESTVATRR